MRDRETGDVTGYILFDNDEREIKPGDPDYWVANPYI